MEEGVLAFDISEAENCFVNFFLEVQILLVKNKAYSFTLL